MINIQQVRGEYQLSGQHRWKDKLNLESKKAS